MKLFLARHGEADAAEPKRYLGKTDLPLTARGEAEAQRLAARLAGAGLTRISCSPLLRARGTADAVAAVTGLPVCADPLLREIDFGDCEGLNYTQIDERYPGAWRAQSDPAVSFPQGESINDVLARVTQFAGTLVDCPAAGRMLVVAHGGSLRVLLYHLLGLDPGRWWRFAWDNGGLSLVEFTPQGSTLLQHNEIPR